MKKTGIQSVQRLRNYTMFLLHKRWLQFCSKSELPFKAGLMTHPVVFHPLPFLFAFPSLSLSLSLSVFFFYALGVADWHACDAVALFIWTDGRLCSTDSWEVSVPDTPSLTGMNWKTVFFFTGIYRNVHNFLSVQTDPDPFKPPQSAYLWNP